MMRLPQGVIDQGKDAIQSLWGDSVTVRRNQKDGNVMKPKTVYQSVPCHLSQSSPAPHEQTQTAAVINPSFSLHIDTDIVIIDGDALEITHNGQTWKGIAGQPFHRTFVNVIPVKAEKVV